MSRIIDSFAVALFLCALLWLSIRPFGLVTFVYAPVTEYGYTMSDGVTIVSSR